MDKYISPAVVRRLPRYLHCLEEMLREGETRVSSGQFADILSLTASQVRQDFSCFGGFGQQGYGYNAQELYKAVADILHLNRGYAAVLVGAGNLGHALCRNFDFKRAGFTLTAAFDPDLSGRDTMPEHVPLYHTDDLREFVEAERPDLAVLTLPRDKAAGMARDLAAWGVRGFWNFTGLDLRIDGAAIENVHFEDSLMTLCYYLDGN